MTDSPGRPEQDHGSRSAPTLAGILISVGLNIALALGMVAATYAKGEDVLADVETEAEMFQCRYIEEGRLHQLETTAGDWQEAEEKICGGTFKDVYVPPTLAVGYALLIEEPGADAILKAQRESCSCSDSEMVPILQDVGIVEAPRLGTLPKQRTLPQIVNNAPEVERNAVNPDLATPEKMDKKDRKKDREKPDLNKLLNATDNFDPARPANDREAVGSQDGSRLSTSATGQGDPYLQKVKARLDNNMNAPSSIPRSELKSLGATAWVKIGENGSVWSWDFKSNSNNTAFDSMVERTIKRFKIGGDLKFPPPPEQWKLKRITIKIDGNRIR